MERTYEVTGMSCDHCVAAVRREVGAVAGVREVAVELDSGQLTVRGEAFSDTQVAAAVGEAGYALAGSDRAAR